MSIAENLTNIQQEIARAAQKAGRDPQSVHLIAVSKTKPLSLIQEAYATGQRDFGENRVQELQDKAPQLPDARWHMIGHLQRNKVKFIAPFIHLIHSVDTERLLQEISKQADKNGRIIDCLLQLNISDEAAKSGLDEAMTLDLLSRIDTYPHVRIKGLMGMAAFSSDKALVKAQFHRLAKAFEQCKQIDHPRVQMEELSMGMSGDFEWAIAEGATLVRIGTAVFGGRF